MRDPLVRDIAKIVIGLLIACSGFLAAHQFNTLVQKVEMIHNFSITAGSDLKQLRKDVDKHDHRLENNEQKINNLFNIAAFKVNTRRGEIWE